MRAELPRVGEDQVIIAQKCLRGRRLDGHPWAVPGGGHQDCQIIRVLAPQGIEQLSSRLYGQLGNSGQEDDAVVADG